MGDSLERVLATIVVDPGRDATDVVSGQGIAAYAFVF